MVGGIRPVAGIEAKFTLNGAAALVGPGPGAVEVGLDSHRGL